MCGGDTRGAEQCFTGAREAHQRSRSLQNEAIHDEALSAEDLQSQSA